MDNWYFKPHKAGKGWDGTIAGKIQNTGTYVWQEGAKIDLGNTILRQGTAVLVR